MQRNRSSSSKKHVKPIDIYKHQQTVAKQRKEKYCKIDFKNGSYQGTIWEKDGNYIISGIGVFYWHDGSFYIGEWRDNKPDGMGQFFFPHGGYLKANFKNGRANNGWIHLVYPNKDEFKGEIKDGLFQGECLRYFSLKSKWVILEYDMGQVVSLVLEGSGQVKGDPNLAQFEKEVGDYSFLYEKNVLKSNEHSSYVCIKNIDSESTYFGIIQYKKPNGLGLLISKSETKTLRGTFINGIVNGKGRQNFENGDVYDGEFLNAKFENQGVYYNNIDKTWFYGAFIRNKIIKTLQNGHGEYPPILEDFHAYESEKNIDQSTLIIDRFIDNNLMEFIEEEALYLLMTLHLKNKPFRRQMTDLFAKVTVQDKHQMRQKYHQKQNCIKKHIKNNMLADALYKKDTIKELEVFVNESEMNIIKVYNMIKAIPKNGDLFTTYASVSQSIQLSAVYDKNMVNQSQQQQQQESIMLKQSQDMNTPNNKQHATIINSSNNNINLKRLNQSVSSLQSCNSPVNPTAVFFTKNQSAQKVDLQDTQDSRNSSLNKLNSSIRNSVVVKRMNSSKLTGKYDSNSINSGSKDHSVHSLQRKSTANITQSLSFYNSENPHYNNSKLSKTNYYSSNNNEEFNIIEDSQNNNTNYSSSSHKVNASSAFKKKNNNSRNQEDFNKGQRMNPHLQPKTPQNNGQYMNSKNSARSLSGFQNYQVPTKQLQLSKPATNKPNNKKNSSSNSRDPKRKLSQSQNLNESQFGKVQQKIQNYKNQVIKSQNSVHNTQIQQQLRQKNRSREHSGNICNIDLKTALKSSAISPSNNNSNNNTYNSKVNKTVIQNPKQVGPISPKYRSNQIEQQNKQICREKDSVQKELNKLYQSTGPITSPQGGYLDQNGSYYQKNGNSANKIKHSNTLQLKKQNNKNYSSVLTPQSDIENLGFSKLSASIQVDQPVQINPQSFPQQQSQHQYLQKQNSISIQQQQQQQQQQKAYNTQTSNENIGNEKDSFIDRKTNKENTIKRQLSPDFSQKQKQSNNNFSLRQQPILIVEKEDQQQQQQQQQQNPLGNSTNNSNNIPNQNNNFQQSSSKQNTIENQQVNTSQDEKSPKSKMQQQQQSSSSINNSKYSSIIYGGKKNHFYSGNIHKRNNSFTKQHLISNQNSQNNNLQQNNNNQNDKSSYMPSRTQGLRKIMKDSKQQVYQNYSKVG